MVSSHEFIEKAKKEKEKRSIITNKVVRLSLCQGCRPRLSTEQYHFLLHHT